MADQKQKADGCFSLIHADPILVLVRNWRLEVQNGALAT